MTQPNEQGETITPLVPLPPQGREPSPMFRPDDPLIQIYSSLPSSRHTLVAITDESQPLADLIGHEIEIVHVIAHSVEIPDQDTGEVLERDRIIVIDAEGTQYAAVSEGVRRSLQLLMAVYGEPPWNPPQRVTMKQVNTRSGKRVYKLIPVLDDGNSKEIRIGSKPKK